MSAKSLPELFPRCFHDHKITYLELVNELNKMSYNDILIGINLVMKYEYGLIELSENDNDFVELFFLLINKYPEPNKVMSLLRRFVHLYVYHDITNRSIELYRMYFDMAPTESVALSSEHLRHLYQSFTSLEQKDIILKNLCKFKVTERFVETIICISDRTLLDIFIKESPSSLELIFEVVVKRNNAMVFEYLSEYLKLFPAYKIYDYMHQIYGIPPSILKTVSDIIKQ